MTRSTRFIKPAIAAMVGSVACSIPDRSYDPSLDSPVASAGGQGGEAAAGSGGTNPELGGGGQGGASAGSGGGGALGGSSAMGGSAGGPSAGGAAGNAGGPGGSAQGGAGGQSGGGKAGAGGDASCLAPTEPCPVGGCDVVTLAKDQDSPEEIAVSACHVYWASLDSGVSRVSRWGSGTVEVLADTSKYHPSALVVDDSTAYWGTVEGHVYAFPFGASDPQRIYLEPAPGDTNGIGGIAVDADYVYWTSLGNGTVSRFSKAGANSGEVRQFATGQNGPSSIAVGPGAIYWVNQGDDQPMRVTISNDFPSDPVALAPKGYGPDISFINSSIALDDTYVYWSDAQSQKISRVVLDGSQQPQVIAQYSNGVSIFLNEPRGIALDGAYLYWAESALGEIVRIKKDGDVNTVLTVADGQDQPVGLFVDTNNFYWVDHASGEPGKGFVRWKRR